VAKTVEATKARSKREALMFYFELMLDESFKTVKFV
jgi:hypothetical protein